KGCRRCSSLNQTERDDETVGRACSEGFLRLVSSATRSIYTSLNCVFPAALPPDVRKWLCPSAAGTLLFSWAIPSMVRRRGPAPKKFEEVCSGRSKTSRTSGGKAAKNNFTKLVWIPMG